MAFAALGRRRPMARRRSMVASLAVASMVLVLSVQGAIAVSSAWIQEFTLNPAGPEPSTDYCNRASVTENGGPYFKSEAEPQNNTTSDCGGSPNTLPAGWLGVKVWGLRDGALCGQSSWH